MKAETKLWLELAAEDYRSVDTLVNDRNYRGAVLFAQQAAEKILKAYCLEFCNQSPKRTHYIEKLIQDAGLDVSEINHVDPVPLSQAYARVRYPDLGRVHYSTRESVEPLLVIARTIYLWVKNKFKNH
jgi:HEPN domain-containing protein